MPACALGLGLTYPQQVATSPQSPPPTPPAFSPSDLWLGAEAGGWWDLSDISSLRIARDGTGAAPIVGEPVGHAQDLGPNGLALEATSDSARPIMIQQDGRLGLRLDGLADYLQTASSVPGPNATTIVAASNITSSTDLDGLMSLSRASGSNGTYHLVSSSSTGGFLGQLRTNNLPGIPAQASDISGVLTLSWDLNAGVVVLRANGVELASKGGYTASTTTERLIFGADRSGTAPLGCDLGAIIHINRVLTPSELTAAETWATARLLP